ncbi:MULTISPECIES: hypothetical protein, partial [unclassified Variovorax]|uniref:hypothetical protein n=1 Tax=unclassified Variovorax TaxID=663243 RepID=UPI001BD489A7
MKRQAFAAAVTLALCGASHAQSNEELKATLDQAMKTIQDLQARVKNLEQKEWAPPAGATAAPAVAGAAAAPGAPPAAPSAFSLGAPVI